MGIGENIKNGILGNSRILDFVIILKKYSTSSRLIMKEKYSASSVFEWLNFLEEKKLISRSKSEKKKSAQVITFTPKGEILYNHIIEIKKILKGEI
jgi:DNA-binding MarR family transcriptional regulator